MINGIDILQYEVIAKWAVRKHGRVSAAVSRDDLLQSAWCGIVEAAIHFKRVDGDVGFKASARLWAKGEVIQTSRRRECVRHSDRDWRMKLAKEDHSNAQVQSLSPVDTFDPMETLGDLATVALAEAPEFDCMLYKNVLRALKDEPMQDVTALFDNVLLDQPVRTVANNHKIDRGSLKIRLDSLKQRCAHSILGEEAA